MLCYVRQGRAGQGRAGEVLAGAMEGHLDACLSEARCAQTIAHDSPLPATSSWGFQSLLLSFLFLVTLRFLVYVLFDFCVLL